MKNILFAFIFVLAANSGLAQEINFNVHGTYSKAVKEKMLKKAKTLADICPGYPTAWIDNYVSTEITVVSNGNKLKAEGNNFKLSDDQKTILKKADLGTDINLDVKYKYQNTITGKDDILNMNFPLTYIPDVEAEYIGGEEQLRKYLKENTSQKIPPASSKNLKVANVRFTIDEQGKVSNALMIDSTGDVHIDAILLDAINKMPDWKPALNSKGKAVAQDFKFSFGNAGC